MNITEQFELADKYEKLWRAVMPGTDVPERGQFLVWVGTCTERAVSRAISRTGAKYMQFRNSDRPMNSYDCLRYVVSVMHKENEYDERVQARADKAAELADAYEAAKPLPVLVDCGVVEGGQRG
jgi:hypothetical protein